MNNKEFKAHLAEIVRRKREQWAKEEAERVRLENEAYRKKPPGSERKEPEKAKKA